MVQQNIDAIASELKKIPQGLIPEPIFNEVARLAALTAIEFVPLRKNDDSVEVLLLRRASDDPFWPGMLHTPGTILRAGDISFEVAYKRLFSDELNSQPLPVELFGNEVILNNRGRTIIFKHFVDVTDVSTGGDFYDTNALPDDLLPEHKKMINEAVVLFEKRYSPVI